MGLCISKKQGGHVWAGRPGRSVITFQNPENEGKNATWEDLQYELYVAYQKEIRNEQHVLSRLKEFWTYRALCHPEEREKIRQIYRTETLQEYAKLIAFFSNLYNDKKRGIAMRSMRLKKSGKSKIRRH